MLDTFFIILMNYILSYLAATCYKIQKYYLEVAANLKLLFLNQICSLVSWEKAVSECDGAMFSGHFILQSEM